MGPALLKLIPAGDEQENGISYGNKGFSQCIAANKQQACGLAAAASCGMVATCEFFVCKLVLLLLVAANLRLLVAATLRLIVCCNLAACAFFVYAN